MAKSLAVNIENTLRGIIHVPALDGNVLMADAGFWRRCTLINPNWRTERPDRIFVNGFAGACKWNSYKVYTDALEEGIRVYQGYALGQGSWAEHCWCMLGSRIIETTGEFDIYYGAELTVDEIHWLGQGCDQFDPTAIADPLFWTFAPGIQRVLAHFGATDNSWICREISLEDGSVKDGLGRS